jgi:hypothetical protein
MYGGLVRYNYDSRWALKLSFSQGEIKGSSAKATSLQENNFSFTSPITDLSLVVEFNFFPYFSGSKWDVITPYIYAGIGGFYFEPVSGGQKLRLLGTEGQNIGYEGRKPYSPIGFDIPMGLGMKLSLSKKVGISAYWELHKTFTDYLDDVSKTYYLAGNSIDVNDPAQVLSDPTKNHQPGMQRGNPGNNDWYFFFGLSVTWKINLVTGKKCRDKKFN